MKKKLLSAALVVLSSVAAVNGADADPVLLTVDGKDIHVSEFKYLYNKNNAQQIQPQTLDEYLDMFVNYKLKVAEALRQGVDRRPEFKTEFNQFRNELAVPYLRNMSVEDSLVREAYGHYLEDLTASHIMLPLKPGNYQKLDSLRREIAEGRISFENAARENSVDRSSAARGGFMGYVSPGRYPWAFEAAAFSVPVGGLTPVVNSGVGYHLIRVESRRPAQGEVNADHILLSTQRLRPAEASARKATADSIYSLLMQGADFADLAGRYSEDPGSASRGGNLGWFGRGAMVAAFDSVAFSLPDGGISRPFQTPFGYHIVRRNGHRDVPGLETMRPTILSAMANDSRGQLSHRVVLDSIARANNVTLVESTLEGVRKMITENPTACDSSVFRRILADKNPVIDSPGGAVYFSNILTPPEFEWRTMSRLSAPNAVAKINEAVRKAYDIVLTNIAQENLMENNANYRNLVNEYSDGILLYEISNANVWDRANKDREGLEAYFHANADRYAWKEPKYKAVVIFATDDSTLTEVLSFAATLPDVPDYKLQDAIRAKFKKGVKVDRVIAAKGENPITDYLGFDGPRQEPDPKSHWKTYAALRGRVLTAPEEASDARGAALADYQSELERRWTEELRKTHSVKVNRKVFEKLKKEK